MSNCVVGSGGLRLPYSIIAEHSVEGCDHFSHDGDDDDLGFVVGVGEAIVEGFEGGTGRRGGAYDSHHWTAGIAGRTRRCGGRVAAWGARAAGGEAVHHRLL